jgi:hypothetical protein
MVGCPLRPNMIDYSREKQLFFDDEQRNKEVETKLGQWTYHITNSI